MGQGLIDWVGQFHALKRDGYRHAVSLETHWRGAGSAEDSTIAKLGGNERRTSESRGDLDSLQEPDSSAGGSQP